MGDPNPARDGLSLELPTLKSLALPVEMGGMPRRDAWRLLEVFHAEPCGLVLRELEGAAVGFGFETGLLGEGEEGGRLIDTAHTLGTLAAVEVVGCQRRIEACDEEWCGVGCSCVLAALSSRIARASRWGPKELGRINYRPSYLNTTSHQSSSTA